ncbi:hypothetical protein GCM10022422_28400 [Flavobacterium ginsengisoli]|uniref:Uncharacterized protein n=1 Tax=Flavobacterium ginsengisoli TaxID=871694 RepID=A0ABP7FM36_9FLAO
MVGEFIKCRVDIMELNSFLTAKFAKSLRKETQSLVIAFYFKSTKAELEKLCGLNISLKNFVSFA